MKLYTTVDYSSAPLFKTESRHDANFGTTRRAARLAPDQNVNLDSKVHGTNMGPIWGRQDPGGPHVGPMNFAIGVSMLVLIFCETVGIFFNGRREFAK